MSNAYPWNDELRDFTARKQIGDILHLYVGRTFNIIAFLFSVLTPGMWAYTYYGFEHSNDTWYKRGLILFGIGAPVTAIIALINPWLLIEGQWNFVQDVFFTKTNPTASILHWQLVGIFPALTLAGLAAIGTSYDFEFSSAKYLRPIKRFGILYQLRRRRNAQAIASGVAPGDGWVAFGLHERDTLAWRSRRFGMIVGRKFDKGFGHGIIVGSNGSGKSVGGLNVFEQCIANGAAGIYPDFKGSRKVEAAARDIAARYGRPFYSFDVYANAFGDNAYYDPLDWPGLPTDKANVILNAMPFAEGGGAQHYRNIIEAYLPIQVEVMEMVGRAPGEGSFDFLLATSDPNELKRRAAPWAQSQDPGRVRKYQEWVHKSSQFNAADLGGLRSNLTKIINSGGNYLRPPSDQNARVINLRAAMAEGAVVYFSLTATLDTTSVVTIGSLLIQDITAMIGSRVNDPEALKRPVIFMPDETSVLEDRAVLLNNAFRQAREAQVWVWPIAQSLAGWPESTRSEVINNALTKVVYNVPDETTQNILVGGLDQVPTLVTQVGQDSADRFGGRTERTVGGKGFAKVDKGPQLTTGNLNLRNRKAWVWFTGGDSPSVTVKPFRRHRVRHEEIDQDIVMVDTIARTAILEAMDGTAEDSARLAAAAEAIEAAALHQSEREMGLVPLVADELPWGQPDAVHTQQLPTFDAVTAPIQQLPQVSASPAPQQAQAQPVMPRFPTGRGSAATPVFAPPALPGMQPTASPASGAAATAGALPPLPLPLPGAAAPASGSPTAGQSQQQPGHGLSFDGELTPEQLEVLRARRQQAAAASTAVTPLEDDAAEPEASMTLAERLQMIKRRREAERQQAASAAASGDSSASAPGEEQRPAPRFPVFTSDDATER